MSVIVDPGASWRVAVGEFPAELLTPPSFEPVELTAGWSLVSNGEPILLSSGSPRDRRRHGRPRRGDPMGVFVECHGDGAITVAAGASAGTDIDCRTSSGTRRLEYPVAGGEPLDVRVTGDGARLWVRLLVERMPGSRRPIRPRRRSPTTSPRHPTWRPDASVVAMGTIGSNEQTILEIAGRAAGSSVRRPAADRRPHRVDGRPPGPRLDRGSGPIVRDPRRAPAPNFIFDSWADATHDAIFYAIATESGAEIHRVGIDGSDDRVVATVAPDPTGFTAELALDESVFVVDACHAGAGCARTVVDAGDGRERADGAGGGSGVHDLRHRRRHDRGDDPTGVLGGGRRRTSSPSRSSGGEPVVVVEDFVGDAFAKAMVVGDE